MNAEQKQQRSSSLKSDKLLAVVRALTGGSSGRADDEHPLPPGPWDPVIRVALEQIRAFGPSPDPWKVFGQFPEPWKIAFASILARHPEILDAIGGGPSMGNEAALNPQPLPPRFTFMMSLAQTVISRAELMQEIVDATRRESQPQSASATGSYIGRLVDGICGNDFRFRWPFPSPRPNWFPKEIDGIDLVMMAAQFEQGVKETASQELQKQLGLASAKLAEVGLSKIL